MLAGHPIINGRDAQRAKLPRLAGLRDLYLSAPVQRDRCPVATRSAADQLLSRLRGECIQTLPIYSSAASVSLYFSQAISRFFRLYTLSTNEWTFLAPVGLIQSASSWVEDVRVFHSWNCSSSSPLLFWLSRSSRLFPSTPFPTHCRRHCSVTRNHRALWYYAVVRLLTARRSPFPFRL